MKSCDRVAAIELLKQKVSLYEQLSKARPLSREDTLKYRQALLDLDKTQRIEAGYNSIMEFAFSYFKGSEPSDLLQEHTPSPPFHWDLCATLREVATSEWSSRTVVAAPRSHSKSTIVSNIFLVWLVCYVEDVGRYYWILLGDKQGTAASQLNAVKDALESNEKLKADFGNLTSKTWNALEIIANGVKIQAAGSGEALRGLKHINHRPNILCDDLEGPDNVSTGDQIQKTLTWFDQTLTNSGDPRRSAMIMVGTLLHYQSLLATLINKRPDWDSMVYAALVKYPDNMHLWDRWQKIYHARTEGSTPAEASKIAGQKALAYYNENEVEMNAGSKVLWPERMPLYEIMKQRATNSYAFSTELQNNPTDVETQVFKSHTLYDIKEFDLDELEILGSVDPSLKETRRSDPSAILTVGKSRQGIYYVLEADARKRSPDQIIDDLLAKTKLYKYKWVSVEAIQYQQFFSDEVKKRSAVAGIYLNVKEFKSNVKKELRITSIEPLVTNGYIRFHPSQLDLLEQLTYFPNIAHEDLLDALSQLIEQDRKKGGRGFIN